MTISANTLIQGATALSFEDLAEVQAAMAKMEIDNLQMFSGGNGTTGFFTVEGNSSKAALDYANEQASSQQQAGWMQFADSEAQALSSAGGLVGGYFANKGTQTELDNMMTPPKAMETTVTPVAPNEQEMKEVATFKAADDGSEPTTESSLSQKANVTGQNTQAAKTEADTVADEDSPKARAKKEESLRTQLSNTNSRYQYMGSMAGNVLSGICKAREGFLQQDITQASGRAQFMQGTTQMINQVTGMTTSAIQAEQGQEQAAAQAYSGIVSLTGAARG